MIYLDDFLAAGGQLHGTAHVRQFTDLAFDSRQLEPGQLFLAVKSDTGDGHDYILDAIYKGAAGVLCQQLPPNLSPNVTYLLVDDTRQTLLRWARIILHKYATPVIAITGSSGKTIAKEAIAAVLSTRFSVFKTYGSYSGPYGLPIALGQLSAEHHLAVLELAADALGEIRAQAELTHPRIGVVTSINRAHIEPMGSLDAIAGEKETLIAALPADGLAVLNRDDARVWSMRARTQAPAVGFGFDLRANFAAQDVVYTKNGIKFTLRAGQIEQRVSLGLFGRHHIYAALAAIVVGQAHGVPISEAVRSLQSLEPMPGRLHPLNGIHDATLLDDTYDAGADCTLAALDALIDHLPDRKRIVVLGGLRQLGHHQASIYQEVGQRAAQVADLLVLKGEAAQVLRSAALDAGMPESHLFVTYTNEEVVRYLRPQLDAQCAVLLKGARQERMEEIARGLMAQPERATALLVRQEPAFRSVQLSLPERPTWLEVDLEAVANNLRQVRQIVGTGVGVMVVLKADGYGHGATRIARTAINNGAAMLGVACLGEGVGLRQTGIDAPILVLGYTPAWQAREAVLNQIIVTVFDLDTARSFSRAAGEVGRIARVHVKVDTGMGRLGLLPDEVLPFMKEAITMPNLIVEGIFTHFSVADEAEKNYTYAQLKQFKDILAQIQGVGAHIELIHAANSAALLSVPEARFNLVRLGIALYGLAPSAEIPLPDGFRPALSFKTRIAQVKTLPPGSYVSYGNTYRTHGEERIAVIPVGYADGFRRAPSHWGYVLVRGQRAPIVGRVCMDQTMIDVTHISGARQGDQVVLIGRQDEETITVEQVARRLGTINYEVVSEILARVPRVS
ncbi:MAG: alanine racemase [Anaerolineae bacterium]|nr:alanine racemase [Anaerolineae bacterium]